jgi:hypothetical protein
MASNYNLQVNGTMDQQLNRVFGSEYPGNASNISIGAQGQNSGYVNPPSSSQMSLIQQGGRRSRRSKRSKRSKRTKRSKQSKNKKGGSLGNVLQQAIVPFGLVGLNQAFGSRKNRTQKYRKNRRYRRR